VLSKLKADPLLKAIPVLLITVVDDAPAGMALGAASFMSKPVDPQRLLAIISGHVRTNGRQVLMVNGDSSTASGSTPAALGQAS
jgi:DNA-binding response OmpR family regulator